MRVLLLVCLGGAIGSGGRYLVTKLAVRALGVTFPWGTLAVNLVGSLVIGAVAGWASAAARPLNPTLQVALMTGVLGGFTTYSSFSYETVQLLTQRAWGTALGYAGGTAVGCIGLCFVGWSISRALVSGA